MGSLTSLDLSDQIDNGLASLRQALISQLRSNHYPPIPLFFLDPCIEAIEAGNDGDFDRVIQLPEGVTDSKTGLSETTARELIEWAHLDFFLTPDDEDWEDDFEYYDDDEDLDLDEV